MALSRLSLQHGDGDHFAGHRRRDLGIPQIGFSGVYRRRGLLHLRRERVDVGGSDIEIGTGDVTVVLGDHGLRVEHLVSVAQHFGERQLRLFQVALRSHVFERCVCRRQGCVRQNRIDFRQQLVFYHLIAALDLKRFQLAGGLSADIDVGDGLQDTGSHHRALHIAAFYCRGDILNLCFAKRPVICERAPTSSEKRTNQPRSSPFEHRPKLRRTLLRRLCRLHIGCRRGIGCWVDGCRFGFHDVLFAV